MAAKLPKRPLPRDSDSEWEYEYSTTDTETFYATLDLSSLAPTNNHGGKRQKPSTPSLTTRAKNAQNQTHQETQTDAEAEPFNGDETEAANETAGEQAKTEAEKETAYTEAEPEQDPLTETEPPFPSQPQDKAHHGGDKSEIQILDLHTTNPIVSYQGTVYSCSWTTPLGTDIILASNPAPTSAPTLKTTKYPLTDTSGRYSLNETFNHNQNRIRNGDGRGGDELPSPILAFSTLRLMARPMKAVPLSEEKRPKGRRGRPPKETNAAEATGINTATAMTGLTGQERMQAKERTDMAQAVDATDENRDEDRIPRSAGSPSPSAQLIQLHPPSPPPIPDRLTPMPADLAPVAGPTPQPPTSEIPTPLSLPPASRAPQPSSTIPPSQPPSTALPIDLSTTLTPTSTHARTAQKSFLERLVAAKRTLGETDEVTVFATRVNTGTGWRSQERLKKKRANGEGIVVDDNDDEDGRGERADGDVDVDVGEEVDDRDVEERGLGGGGDVVVERRRRRREANMRGASTRVAPRQGYSATGKMGKKASKSAVAKTVHWEAGGTEARREGSSEKMEDGLGARRVREGSNTVTDDRAAAASNETMGRDYVDRAAGVDAVMEPRRELPMPKNAQSADAPVSGDIELPSLQSPATAIDHTDATGHDNNLKSAVTGTESDVEMGNT